MKKYLFLVYRNMHVHLKNVALTGGGREGRGKAHHFVSSNRHIFLKFTCTNMTFDGTSSPPTSCFLLGGFCTLLVGTPFGVFFGWFTFLFCWVHVKIE